MTTMGMRGFLAVAFMGSAGITGAYQTPMGTSVPVAQAMAVPAGAPVASATGLLHRILVRGCELTSGAGRPDSASARTRRSQCDADHSGATGAH